LYDFGWVKTTIFLHFPSKKASYTVTESSTVRIETLSAFSSLRPGFHASFDIKLACVGGLPDHAGRGDDGHDQMLKATQNDQTMTQTGWWFGTCDIFHNILDNPSH
jgi:hypothetical protein